MPVARVATRGSQRSGTAIPYWQLVAAILAIAIHAGSACNGGSTVVADAHQGECSKDEECPLGEICSIGDCVAGCRQGAERCPGGTACIDGFCRQTTDGGVDAAPCPDDMVDVEGLYCMDRYEASRPDATKDVGGVDTSRATSRQDVIPWYPITLAVARAACAAATAKYLCTTAQFETACRGPDQTVYAYGDLYDPVICNSIDTYCQCDSTACESIEECPYPHCYNQPPTGEAEPANGCSATPHATPTGAFPGCTNEYGVYDINGNVWELVNDGSSKEQFRGGAYNCIDSELLHRCDYVAKNILAKGFRCCRSP